MLVEYFVILLVLLAAAGGFYWLYDRYVRGPRRSESERYVEALRDLLDGRPETAFSKLRQVVAEDSSNIDAYLRLSRILREHRKPDRALQIDKDLTLRSGLDRRERAAILKQLCLDYLALEEYDTAQAALKEMISYDGANRWAWQTLLRVQKHLKLWEDAFDTAAQILKIEGDKSKKPLAYFRYQMGLEQESKGERRKARVLFKEALGLDPKFVPAYLAIGDSYLAEGRKEDAVNFWNKLIDAVPTEGHQAIDRLEKVLFDLGRFGDIVDICQKILKHSPKDHKALMTLADFYKKKGELDVAEQRLLAILENQPQDIEAVLGLLRIYIEQEDIDKIKQVVHRLEDRQPQRPPTAADDMIDTSLIGIG